MIYLFTPALMNNFGTLSTNLGDLIIHEAVFDELSSLFPKEKFVNISSHTSIENFNLIFRKNDLCFVGGSNLLSSNMNHYAQWKIDIKDIFKIKNVILMGVGWWQYQSAPNFYTKLLLNQVLSKKIIHSVRDNYTATMLRKIGINNVVNTHCPTLWPLIKKDLNLIPKNKSENILLMLTDYKKSPITDKILFDIAEKHYEKIYFWPQGSKDLDYFNELGITQPVTILRSSIDELDKLLKSDIGLDYIGTRLHGGIRCIVNDRRSLVLEVDNRAKEISKDTGFPTTERDNFNFIETWIQSKTYTNINLHEDSIISWRAQFSV